MTSTEALVGLVAFMVAFWAFAATMHLLDAVANVKRLTKDFNAANCQMEYYQQFEKMYRVSQSQTEHWKSQAGYWRYRHAKLLMLGGSSA